MTVRTSPCDWPIVYPGCTDEVPIPEPIASMPASGMFEEMAVSYLWNWTGKNYGVCTHTIRPCRQDCTEGMSTWNGSGPQVAPGLGVFGTSWTPVIIDGLWYNVGCGRCGDRCGCGGEAPLRLPGPVANVAQIAEDGVLLDPSTYHVDNNRLLVRTDGRVWSPCGLEITYDIGVAVPTGGQIAAGVLANELAKAACGDKSCGLPQRVQTVTRQGVTIAMLDAFDDVDKGHTGIWLIDSWVASVTKAPARAKVLSPDVPRQSPRRTTWP